MKKLLIVIPVSALMVFILSPMAQAVPPPDFIFSAGAQIAQVFAVAALFISAAFGMSYNFIKTKLILIRHHKPSFIAISIIGIIAISIGLAYGYNAYQQNKAYDDWLAESESYSELAEEKNEYMPSTSEETDISLLDLGAVPNAEDVNSNEKFISYVSDEFAEDATAEFVEEYYKAIAEGNLDYAYELSKQSVSIETFKSWYINTTKITLDNFTKIDSETVSLELTLYENNKYARYGTLMSLKYSEGIPIQVADSTVQVLSEGSIEGEGTELVIVSNDSENDFYTSNENTNLSISNEDFQAVLDSGESNYIVLDAREDLEYENGYFPGSLHIRYADLQAGKWIELPIDKFVYVICWSGIRGSEVADFLRTKNIIASYLEGGASEWVAYGGEWVGNINFGQKYTENQYTIVYTTDEVRDYVAEGVVLVDCREPWNYDEWHIDGSINIPIMYTPSIELEDAFAQVPAGSTFITVCDGYVNCFDAKITGAELESRGYTFLGRYNKPWEY